MAAPNQKLPPANKKNFRTCHAGHMNTHRPAWTAAERTNCLNVFWYEAVGRLEKFRYNGNYAPPFTWQLPIVAPGDFGSSQTNAARQRWWYDAANWPPGVAPGAALGAAAAPVAPVVPVPVAPVVPVPVAPVVPVPVAPVGPAATAQVQGGTTGSASAAGGAGSGGNATGADGNGTGAQGQTNNAGTGTNAAQTGAAGTGTLSANGTEVDAVAQRIVQLIQQAAPSAQTAAAANTPGHNATQPTQNMAAPTVEARRVGELERQLEELREQNDILLDRVVDLTLYPHIKHMVPVTDKCGEESEDGPEASEDPQDHSTPRKRKTNALGEREPGIDATYFGFKRRRGNKIIYDDDLEAAILEDVWKRVVDGEIEGLQGETALNHDGASWKMVRVLGAGGFGRAMLWVKTDLYSGFVTDKVVAKDVSFRDRRCEWTDPRAWRDNLPIEVSMHEHLKRVEPPCPYILNSRGYRISPSERGYRLYLEHMPCGDVYHMIPFPECSELRPQPSIKDASCRTPIAFVYYTFLAMVEACLALDRGCWGDDVLENGGRLEDWIPIVHRDLKPENIFLNDEDAGGGDGWDMYPTPVLADFGLAFETYDSDLTNPQDYQGVGTWTHRAPEQAETYPVRNERRLTDRTNVYAIASSVFQLWLGELPGFYGEPWDLDDEEKWPDPLKEFSEYVVRIAAANERHKSCTGRGWYELWELERWETDWLLRLPHQGAVDALRGDETSRLSAILRDCLHWSGDERPSLLTLRTLLKRAIEELNINPLPKIPEEKKPPNSNDWDAVWEGKVKFRRGTVPRTKSDIQSKEARNDKYSRRRLKGDAIAYRCRRTLLQFLRPVADDSESGDE